MLPWKLSGFHRVIFLVTLAMRLCNGYEGACVDRPLGTKTAPLPPDNRFILDIVGVDDMYIPGETYTIKLYSRDGVSSFIAFIITASNDTKYNERNPRKPIYLQAGLIVPSPETDEVISSQVCNNTVIQSNITPKTLVEVRNFVQSNITSKTLVEAKWIAPPKDNKCVSVYAMLAVKPDVWYNNEGPLTKRVCEDRRKADDMQPMENDNCQVCEEARYQLTFFGMWSYNTHPEMFPTTKELARFSDVVGASHSKNFNFYKYNTDASLGLKMLAEQGNTTQLEVEIQKELGSNVRTIIKATSPVLPNMTTSAIFRASRDHHLVSLVTAINPSPDWFLGVSNLELCQASSGQWARNIRLNLYPLDAGTDSGSKFESPNEETSPPQPISSAVINKDVPKEQMKPFARLQFDLIRTYSTPNCVTDKPTTEDEDGKYDTGFSEYERPASPPAREYPPTSEEPPKLDPESSEECPMTEWEEWGPCEGPCEDGKLSGYQRRERYHLVDGVPIEKYNPDAKPTKKEVPQYCKNHFDDFEENECVEDCTESEITAEGIVREPIKPGQGW